MEFVLRADSPYRLSHGALGKYRLSEASIGSARIANPL